MNRTFLIVLAAVSLAAGVREPLPAQQNAEASRRALQGSGVTEAEILQRLRASGMSRTEIKRRLAAAGYDPAMVDAYLDLAERGRSEGALAPPEDFAAALEGIGVTREGLPAADTGRAPTVRDPGGDTAAAAATVRGLPIFGRSLFTRTTSEFDPLTAGPVPPDYRVGPGDQLVVILTGAAQTAYTMDVMRDGTIVIPDAGPVAVNGLTLEQVESVLMNRLGEVYSDVGRGGEARTQFSVSVSRIRSNQVVVAGDVERPGAYTLSSLGTAFTALYLAGGPNPIGSFRQITVRRAGRMLPALDLYEYLVDGVGGSDLRLEQGDFVFVPVAGPRVGIEGAVRRPASYELKPGEGLRDLLHFAGGLNPEAVIRRIQIDRILPPYERTPGVDRVLVDVDLAEVFDQAGGRITLEDGDLVRVFSVSEARRKRVAVTGAVHRPGTYQWRPGMTVADLLGRADGVAAEALLTRAHVYRLNEELGQRELLPIALVSASGEASSVPLADRDSLVVLSREELATPGEVTVSGFVKEPGTYRLAPGMTVEDLILRAGGYLPGADAAEAEVARMPEFASRSDTVARVFRVRVGGDAPEGTDGARGVADRWTPSAQEVHLVDGDRVFIRKAPGYEPLHTVVVTGQVLTPSEYVLDSRTTRITDVIGRAGGLTGEASIRGVQLFRGEELVAVDLAAAQASPGSRQDFVLEAGDSLHVPRYDPTVLVIGKGVAFETRVPYQPGAGLTYYISQSGGYTENADRDRVSITYQNGQRAINQRFLLFRRAPEPRPGSTIVVPEVPLSELIPFNAVGFATTAVGLLSSLATLLVLLNQLEN
ncbi:MAG: SLBB domain-containing protein [Gemmatimonadetes bacterium]|nr:SLBB domain-containing protein [Gemmatimonadota bacterium]